VNPTIQACTEADATALSRLLVRTWHATFDRIYGVEKVDEITSKWHAPDQLRMQMSQAGSITLASVMNGEFVGTVTGSGTSDGGIRLQRLYIAPEHQRQGIGKRLLDAFVQSFVTPLRIELNVSVENANAIAFYETQGFSIRSTDILGGTGENIHVMVQDLKSGSSSGKPLIIRPVRDDDAQDLIGLITLCFAEYPGCFFDPHGDMPDIVRPAQSRLAIEGQFLVVEDARGRISACIGVDFPESVAAELHRLYVRADTRGRGLAKLLTLRVEDFARERGASRVILWSDTRFSKAHILYEGLGYTRGPITRSLGDISHSREFFFEKAL
jgi:ribosomal protein S18 acetylase RimI-like enzyme